jgi:hypothetical protein
MGRVVESAYRWTVTSTGAGKAYLVRSEAAHLSFFVSGTFGSSATGSTAATATAQIEATFGSSAGAYVSLGTASTMSHGTPAALHQFTGPFEWVRPRVSAQSASTETLTFILLAN